MWVIGTKKEGSGYCIYRWVGKAGFKKGSWKKVAGSGVRISVGPGEGNAYVVNKNGGVF